MPAHHDPRDGDVPGFPPVIQVIGFRKAYRETIAVADLDFVVRAGEVLGLVGPNGAGKTTTLRAIAGIIPPTRGELRVAGHDVVEDPVAAKAQLGYVPDDPRLFDALTVWEHLQFVAAAYRVPDFPVQVERLLEQFELLEQRGRDEAGRRRHDDRVEGGLLRPAEEPVSVADLDVSVAEPTKSCRG